MEDHDDIDRRLRAANRVPIGTGGAAGSQALLDELGTRIVAEPVAAERSVGGARRRMRLRPRFARRGVLLASVAGLLVVGGAAAATILTTYTGHYNKGWEIKAGGPGEDMLMGAPNFCQAALKLSSDITYPAGYAAWRPWVLIAETQQPKVTTTGACGSNSSGGEGKATEASTGALRGWFAMSAFCAWVYDWRDAENSGNTAEAARAASVIAGALRWPAVVAEDPHPSAGSGSYGTLQQHMTLFGWFIPFQSAVRSGDASQVGELIRRPDGGAGCSYFDPPADSDGGTVNPYASKPQGHS